jgi:hypothetical protein
MSFEQAEAALSSAAAEDAGSAQAASTPEPSSSGEGAGATPSAVDSFTSIDPNSLPPELQAAYKSLQGDYTRKTQEIAQMRSLQESLGDNWDPDRVTQSMEFVQALETDADFAHAVYNQLNDVLMQAGLLEGAPAPEGYPNQGVVDPEFDDPESVLAQQIAELTAWKDQQEAAQQEQQLAAYIQRQDMAIRQEHPEWQDQDYDAVYQLAFAHGGDLMQAAQTYETLSTRFVEDYIARKSQVPSGATTVVSGGPAAVPSVGFGDDLDAAHRAALEHFRTALG